MIESSIVLSVADREPALAYLVDHLRGSPLVELLGIPTLLSECSAVTLVTSSEPPPGLNLSSAWGGKIAPPQQWLITEILQYVRKSTKSLVLLEDANSSPRDPYLATREHPPFWYCENTVYWPVNDGVDVG